MTKKAYLGDGCFVEFDGYELTLTTENGISITNRVVLEPSVYAALTRFVDGLKAEQTAADEAATR